MSCEYQGDNVIRFTNDDVDQNVKWERAEFPHPLITVDYNKNDEVMGVSVVVPGGIAEEVGT